MDLSPQEIRWIFVSLFVLIISVALHEFGHAFMADRLGDDTPRRQGRVTLNPIAHADPIGTLLLPLVGGAMTAAGSPVGGFGWGKPVQWQPSRIRKGIRMSTANILVSFAGPFMNLVLGTFLALLHAILVWRGAFTLGGNVSDIFVFSITTNFVLFFFNLVPVPPLDGGHILQAFMPYRHRQTFDSVARFGPFIILAIAFIPQLRWLFLTPALWCSNTVEHGMRALFGV